MPAVGQFQRWCIEPTRRIIGEVRARIRVPGSSDFRAAWAPGCCATWSRCLWMPSASTGRQIRSLRATRSSAVCRYREISIRWPWLQAEQRSMMQSTEFSKLSPRTHSSSISGTASCRTRRCPCGADGNAGSRAAELSDGCCRHKMGPRDGGNRYHRGDRGGPDVGGFTRSLPVGQGYARHCDYRLDGGHGSHICRGCSSITAMPSQAPDNRRPSR